MKSFKEFLAEGFDSFKVGKRIMNYADKRGVFIDVIEPGGFDEPVKVSIIPEDAHSDFFFAEYETDGQGGSTLYLKSVYPKVKESYPQKIEDEKEIKTVIDIASKIIKKYGTDFDKYLKDQK